MGWFAVMIRRSLWLVLVTAAGGGAYAWWRDHSAPEVPAPAEWPPLTSTPNPTTPPVAPAHGPDSASSGSVSSAAAGWTEPLDDGSCPVGHPVKANNNSGIFHMPGGRFYDRTKPERCYSTPDAAITDGYRQAKN